MRPNAKSAPSASRQSRRAFFKVAGLAAAAFVVATVAPLRAWGRSLAAGFNVKPMFKAESADAAIEAFLNGAKARASEQLIINAPSIAESGNVVPIEIDASGLGGGVRQLAFFIANNPRPFNSVYHFNGAEPAVSFRVRMLESTDVVAIARLGNGQCLRSDASVKVTTGGCGG